MTTRQHYRYVGTQSRIRVQIHQRINFFIPDLTPAASYFIAGRLVQACSVSTPLKCTLYNNDLSVHACNRHIHLITLCQCAKKSSV